MRRLPFMSWPNPPGPPATWTAAIASSSPRRCSTRAAASAWPRICWRLYIKQLLEAHQTAEVNIAWQGGEPTLMGLPFFQRAVALAEQHRRPDQQVLHTIQTNGTLIDDAWAAFFKEHNFLVGLSVDGPRAMHDAYRVNKGGAGSFDQVMAGWAALRRHNVDFNILCTLHAANADHPLEVYRFFRDELHAEFIQFIPIIERVDADAPTYLPADSGCPRPTAPCATGARPGTPGATARSTPSMATW